MTQLHQPPPVAPANTGSTPPAVPDTATAEHASGDRAIRGFAWLVLTVLIAITFYISYRHLITLARRYGEPEDTARLVPLAVDGLIIMASLVLLYCTRARIRVPRLARFALWLGIGATLTGNAAHGLSSGIPGALVSGTSALVLVIAVELFMRLLRAIRDSLPQEVVEKVVYRDRTIEVPTEIEVRDIPSDRFEAARWAYQDSLQHGRRKLGRRALSDRFGLEIREAAEVITEVDQELSGTPAPAPPVQTQPFQPQPIAAVNGSSGTGSTP